MAGLDLRTIQKLGGWRETKMIERYAHLSPAHESAAIQKVSTGKHFTTLFTTSEGEPAVNH